MKNVKHDILSMIDSTNPDSEYLQEWGLRTNLFLGTKPRGNSNPAFSRSGNGGTKRCLISQLFDHWYGRERADEKGGQLLHFECLRYDCMFFKDKLFNPAHGYPESWEYDWLIEVENDFECEFVMTLMGLLDVVCNHRLAIFFADNPDLNAMTDRFVEPWEAHVDRYSFVKEFHICALLLPNSFQSTERYKAQTALIHWDAETKRFTAVS